MKVSFVKGEKRDRVYVLREDGSEAAWDFPSYGPRALPHDLVHFAVERALGRSDGVYARVAAGVDLARLNDAANRAGGRLREKYAGLGDDIDGVLRSEALAAQPWLDDAVGDASIAQRVREACAGYEITAPGELDVAAVRAEVRALHEAWLALPSGRALALAWPG